MTFITLLIGVAAASTYCTGIRSNRQSSVPQGGTHDSIFIFPVSVTIAHSGVVDDTVMLRVVGTLSGVPDADSLVEFARETMLDGYPTFADTTIAVQTGGGIVPPPDTCFYAIGPYANPSGPLENDVSALVHYCSSGSIITAQVYDMMGHLVGVATSITSDGQVWDRIPINSPATAGTYYVQISVGGYGMPLGYTVY